MKKVKDIKTQIRQLLIPRLRRASYSWKPRTEAFREARIERGLYVCNICKKHTKAKEIALDHIVPVVGPNGFTTWDEYIARMFCEKEGLQALCSDCHDAKSKKENEERLTNRKLKNKLES